MKVAINGLGRIGRLVLHALMQVPNLELIALNDVLDIQQLLYLLQFDSVHGRSKADIFIKDQSTLVYNNHNIAYYQEKDPSKLPWKSLGVQSVVESTGLFLTREKASAHLEAGARYVLLSAPAKEMNIPTFVMGVNHQNFVPDQDFILSNASCTTNCLAPLAKVLLDQFGIEEGLMTTIHAVTAGQSLVDGPSKKDWRAGRSALLNIIPASTGAAKAVGLCLPELQGKLTGMAFRVPVADASVVDLTVRLKASTSLEKITQALTDASQAELFGILKILNQPIVSSDCIGDSHSCLFDPMASLQLNPSFFKLVAWYDNEAGYAQRLVDLLEHIQDVGPSFLKGKGL